MGVMAGVAGHEPFGRNFSFIVKQRKFGFHSFFSGRDTHRMGIAPVNFFPGYAFFIVAAETQPLNPPAISSGCLAGPQIIFARAVHQMAAPAQPGFRRFLLEDILCPGSRQFEIVL